MKNMFKGLLIVCVVMVGLIGNLVGVNASVKGNITTYQDGSFSYIDNTNSVYEYTVKELGDWNYNCKDVKDLNKLIASYNLCKDNRIIVDKLEVVSVEHKGNKVITNYNDKSYSVVDSSNCVYEFYPAITEDWTINFDNESDMNKCIQCYSDIIEFGCY